MAIVDEYRAYVDLGMSNKKKARVEYWVTAASAIAYFEAPTQPLKDGTAVGQLLLSVEDLSLGTMMGKGVYLVGSNDAFDYPTPDAEIYAFDKLGVMATEADGDITNLTIPGRLEGTYTVTGDGVTVIIEGGSETSEIADFVAAFPDIVVSKYGNPLEVQKMEVVS